MVTSLVDLCIKKWIDNVRSLADVGEIDDYLLDKMLALCSVNQLKYVERCTKVSHGRNLSPVTDKLWKTFYEARFDDSDEVIEKMGKDNVPFKWKKAYEYKKEDIIDQERMRRLDLQVYGNGYRHGAAYYRSSSRARAREETDFLNGDGEDYYHYYNNNNNDDDVEEEDDETDVEEEFLERVGGGQVSVVEALLMEEEEEEEEDDDDDYHYHCFNNGYADEEGEEEFLERVGREVSVEELVEEEIQIEKAEEMEVEEQIRIEEGEEVEEQTQILEEEEDRDMSEVGQGEDGYGDDSPGNDYYDGGCDSDYGSDDGYY